MIRKLPSFTVCLILILGLFVTIDLCFEMIPLSQGITRYVDDGGGAEFTSIQDAIDASDPWDTVYVYNGTYNEVVVIDKIHLELIGEDRDTTIINAQGPPWGSVVSVDADWVTVSGFTITDESNGIELNNVQNCVISNNYVHSHAYGIYLDNSDGNEVSSNIATDHMFYGIYLKSSHGNDIIGNDASSNDYGGIFLESSSGNTINANTGSLNVIEGVGLWKSSNNILSANTFSDSGWGLRLSVSTGDTLTGNTMTDNSGIFIEGGLLEHWNTHNIDTANTVNGKPVYYWKNQIGGNIPSGAGQVILANCKDVNIEDQVLTDGTVGISLGFSSNNSITNCTLSNNLYNIYFRQSNGNNITDTYIGQSPFDMINIPFYSSVDNVFVNCSFDTWATEYTFNFNGNSHATVVNGTFDELLDLDCYFEDTTSTLTVKWHLNINVTDYLGNPVPDAKVRIEDDKDTYDETFITDEDGYIKWIPLTEYIEQDIDGDNYGEWTYYTPHKIMAWNDTLVGYVYPDPMIDQTKTINVILHNGTLLNLENGWNLVSLPRIQANTSIETVLQSIEGHYDLLQWYNITDNNDHWKYNHLSKPPSMNDLNDIDHMMGFWLHITELQEITLVVIGDEPKVNQSIMFYPGWNLVGYPSLSNKNRTSALNNIEFGTDVDSIWAYNSTIQAWVEIHEVDYFEIGKGYWIHSNVEKIWDVPL